MSEQADRACRELEEPARAGIEIQRRGGEDAQHVSVRDQGHVLSTVEEGLAAVEDPAAADSDVRRLLTRGVPGRDPAVPDDPCRVVPLLADLSRGQPSNPP